MNLYRPTSARARVVATLADEILSRPDTEPFPIESEHELCRRFNISRVTVRLALGDLENRGLIYRRHGKGTFAHGKAQQSHRAVSFLMIGAHTAELRPTGEMIRGAQTIMAPLRSAVVVISARPEEWRPETAGYLSGVIILPDYVTERDLQVLRARNVPYILAAPSELPGPRINLGQRQAARQVAERLLKLGHRRMAIVAGFDAAMDGIKREGIHDAMRAQGLDVESIQDVVVGDTEETIMGPICDLLRQKPRVTAIMALDDTLALRVNFQARLEGVPVPQHLSIVGFHDWPFLRFMQPRLDTVHFDFFEAGQQAAEALNRASFTGEAVKDLFFESTYVEGHTVGPVPQG